ncbi:MAG TPA: LPS assembly protein LptD, partial [Planctomycetota bacterium]|nr:LPS assembly protein LptD [Planctomycetota bacterium]
MSAGGSARRTVLVSVVVTLCASGARVVGESATPPVVPVTARADAAVRHRANGQTMLLLTGHVELSRGGSRMEADRVLVWIDEARSEKLGVVVMAAYGEGNVLTVEKGSRATSPRVFFHWTASDLTVDDADGFIALSTRPFGGPFIDRAEEVRSRGAVPAVEAPIPPKARPPVGQVPPRAGPVTQIVEPTRIGLIYGQQQEGPHIRSFVEGDYRVTVVSHYPDIVFFDPGSRIGRLEVLAENMVIWVNEKKLQEGGPLKDAELEIYAEGQVVIYQALKSVRCEQLYYDYKNQRGLIVGGPGGDAVVKVFSEEKNLPIFYRAKEFRQVSADEYLSKKTIITTSEFGIPDWGVYASEVKMTAGTRTMRDTWGRAVGTEPTEHAEARHARLVFSGIPVFYWPYFERDLKNDKTALKHLQLGHDSDLGMVVRTVWDLYDLGIPQNEWSELDLLADYFSNRGGAGGLSFKYDRPDMTGEVLAYYLHDTGRDHDGTPAEKTNRGRFKWLHRQPLDGHWRLDTELSWINDSEFLREYNEVELKEDKEQETLFYLRYLNDNRYFGLLGKWRLNNWQTQNEHMPEARFTWLGEPLFGGTLTYIQDSRLGNLRRRWNDDLQGVGLLGADYRSWRAYTEHEVQFPFRVGFVKLA